MMSFEMGPARRPAQCGPEWDAGALSPHRRLSRPAGAGRDLSRAGVGVARASETDGARNSGWGPVRRLAMGAASEAGRPEVPDGQGVLIGSDFADVIPLGAGRVALVLGDVCSKSLAAAPCAPQTLYALRTILGEHARPARALGQLNRYLCGSGLPTACPSVALSLAVVDVGTGEVVCACAGSEPPLILRAGGSVEAVGACRVGLGVDAGWTFRAEDFLLGEGDALLLVTDGVTGARRANSAGGKGPLCCEGLAGLALDAFDAGGPPGRVAWAVLDGAKAFAGGTLHDDGSVLVAARR